ncbi:hypothetical protein D018_2842B, partial [Vibrio parahaemolyticus VP2007-007]
KAEKNETRQQPFPFRDRNIQGWYNTHGDPKARKLIPYN